LPAVAQPEIELILTRRLATWSCRSFVVDLEGTMIYLNEPAETILGRRYEETDDVVRPVSIGTKVSKGVIRALDCIETTGTGPL